MRVLTSWLKEFVPFRVGVERLATDLTMAGLEVEGVEDAWHGLARVVAVRVIEAGPLAEDGRLKLCRVDAGNRRLQVVCGAPNAAPGLWTALALPGAVLPDERRVAAATVAGARSEGMLCSEAELGIGEVADRIVDLAAAGRRPLAGRPLADLLGLEDWILEIGVTPNRADCLSVLGVAREVAAVYGLEPGGPDLSPPPAPAAGAGGPVIPVRIDAPEACGRYAAAVLEGIRVGPSPAWMQRRLRAGGIRPINNVVDVTNYVLLETGQPLHAFDLDRLDGPAIVVRPAAEAEHIATLDGKVRALQAGMLVIADRRRPVAVAGVMGGAESEVTGATTRILLESAWFEPRQVRRTARALRLSTESSYRFERGTDPEGVPAALGRAVRLLAEVAGARVAAPPVDLYPAPFAPPEIALRPSRANRLLGTNLSAATMARLLRRASMQVEAAGTGRGKTLRVRPPSFRHDVREAVDLVEEIARLHGYGRIRTRTPAGALETRPAGDLQRLATETRRLLTACGLDEIVSYSFDAPDSPGRLRLPPGDPRSRPVRLRNPLSEDQSILRTSLVPSLLGAASRNIARRCLDLRLFEVGKVFWAVGDGRQPEEHLQIAGLWTGRRHPPGWAFPPDPVDLHDVKGVVEALLDGLGCPWRLSLEVDVPYLAPGTAAAFVDPSGRHPYGHVGQVHPDVLAAWDIRQDVFLFEVSAEAVARGGFGTVRRYAPIPRHPAVERDLAVIVPADVPAGALVDFVTRHEVPALERVEVFDFYTGPPIPRGAKSVGLRLRYRAPDRTLTEDEVSRVHDPLVARLLEHFEARLRT
ncbi:phenylalanine--tRNA ligase subunit beta [Dissulfurirhabdus thermomarina]|uniref:Phenylalanine--tRNA ligase beta subunit n=1 Tax=Dissulfurirhabdus thermomarina TaxID=1765737 RepID=A0A6N9TMI1_DISTH|nr:phenylalanine--tRNA ligase subunit beta [Dissulfurirhabdus thermomarina]NDY41283.1 phenylalanine--tRNA ligase subunit beta [Dissulfurirhabdus thermomarina]NMX23740.1 phenylalanine--tRNA ligase subunit beta [Dissulfurirhabdus thermomarina]